MTSVLASVRSSFSFVHGFGFLSLLWAALIDTCGSGAQQVQELPGRPLIRAWTDRHGLNALAPPPVDPAPDAAGCLPRSNSSSCLRSAFPTDELIKTVQSYVKPFQYFVAMRAIA